MRSVKSIQERMAQFLSGPQSLAEQLCAHWERGRALFVVALTLAALATIVSHFLKPKFHSNVILILQEPAGPQSKILKIAQDDQAEKTLFYLRSHAFALEFAAHLRASAEERDLFEQMKAYGACAPSLLRTLLYETLPTSDAGDGEEQCIAVQVEKVLAFQKTGPDNIAVNVKTRVPDLSVAVANSVSEFAVKSIIRNNGEDLDQVARFLEEKIKETNEQVAEARILLEQVVDSKAVMESQLTKVAVDRQLPLLKNNERDTVAQLERQQRILRTLQGYAEEPDPFARRRPALTASEALDEIDRLTRENATARSPELAALSQYLLRHPESAPLQKGWIASLEASEEELQERLQNIRARLTEMEAQVAAAAALDKKRTEANARVDVANNLLSELTKRLYEAQVQRMTLVNNVRLLRKATTANFAAVMRLPLKLILILLLTASAVLVGLFLWEEIDPSIRRAEDARSEGIPLGGAVPLLLSDEAKAFIPEAMQWIQRRTLDFSTDEKRGKLITLVGIESKVGTSLIARYLGESLAQEGSKVLLLTLDPQAQSRLLYQRDFTVRSGEGLTLYQHKTISTFQILPVAGLIEQGEVLGSSARFGDFLKGLQRSFDLVILDNPSLTSLGSRAGQLELSDVVYLVARHRKTRRTALREALDILAGVRSPLVYLLINGVKVEVPSFRPFWKKNSPPPTKKAENGPPEEKAA